VRFLTKESKTQSKRKTGKRMMVQEEVEGKVREDVV
jgi:ribosomal protein S18